MPTYVLLQKWTQKGIETVKDTPQRIERAKEMFKSVGGEIKQIHFVFGEYDMVVVAEAPSDEAIGKAILTIVRAGNASLLTLKAFTEAEGIAIINSLP
jgi:uncharacterized protein with GYD domain